MWLAVFAFADTVGIILLCTAGALIGLVSSRGKLAIGGSAAAGTAGLAYALLLLGAGATSRQRELGTGEEKHICETDCHLAYSVLETTRAQPGQVVVTMKMRFDETTIGPRRGDAPLTPGKRHILLIDEDGKQYAPLRIDGLDAALRPGQSTTAALTFQMPKEKQARQLRFEGGEPMDRLMIGSETSPLHKHIVFRLS